MASKLCNPCVSENKSATAIRYCYDCEESLCKDCHESHLRFKALRSHNIIDLHLLKSKPPSPEKYCVVHLGSSLDFFCTQHDTTCCKSCIADVHRSCDNILPLDVASKDIKTSSLVTDSLLDTEAIIDDLKKLITNREENITSLQSTKSTISQLIDARKAELIKHLDDMKQTLMEEVSSIQQRDENEITEQKEKLVKLHDAMVQKREDLEFLKEHGSNTQLFLSVRQTINSMQKFEVEAEKLSSLFTEIDIKFQVEKDINKTDLGSVSEVRSPCKINYTSKVQQQAQTEAESIRPLTKFEIEGNINLKSGEVYFITCITITPDNNLLFTNFHELYPKVYMYRNCKHYDKETTLSSDPFGIAVIAGTQKAVVTLPAESSIQFINTTDLTQEEKVNIGMRCYGVTATEDRIFVGGEGIVSILDMRGSHINTVVVGTGKIYSLCYDKERRHILCRYLNIMRCVSLEGTVVYQQTIPGEGGLTVDRLGNTYVSLEPKNEIHRLSSNGKVCDVIFKAGDGLTKPSILSFNKDFSKLFVITNQYSHITVKQCK